MAPGNYSLVDPAGWQVHEFKQMAEQLQLEVPGYCPEDSGQFLFELPVEFGGTITAEMLQAQASQHHQGGMMAFDIKAGAEAASR